VLLAVSQAPPLTSQPIVDTYYLLSLMASIFYVLIEIG